MGRKLMKNVLKVMETSEARAFYSSSPIFNFSGEEGTKESNFRFFK
jgi:hypothetical protein